MGTPQPTISATAWKSSPADNFGWIFIPGSGDGTEMASSEHSPASRRPQLTIVYSVPGDLPAGAPLSLSVVDVRGQLVRRFTVDPTPGTHELQWNGTDERGATVASGVYVTRFVCGDDMVTRRMTMLK